MRSHQEADGPVDASFVIEIDKRKFNVTSSRRVSVLIIALALSPPAVREATLPALMCTLGSFSSSSSDVQNHNEWSPLLELFFHWRIGRLLEAMVDDVSTATVAFTCHFALDVLCEK